jgi:hypothetical protein
MPLERNVANRRCSRSLVCYAIARLAAAYREAVVEAHERLAAKEELRRAAEAALADLAKSK